MKRTVLLLVALAMLAAVPALAQSVVSEAEREALRGVPDRWGLDLGSFWQTFTSRVRLDGKSGEGTEIDLEKDMGLVEHLTDFQLGAFYRFSDHSRLDLSYLSWKRANAQTIDQEIKWGDVIYEARAEITTKSSAQMINAIYKYSFYNNGKVTFGLNGGISSLWSDFTLSGKGTISGGEPVSKTIAESKKVIFPIPVIGVHFEMTLIKRLFWKVDDNFFAASISGYDGNLNELTTSITYFPTKNVGVGGGFASTMYKVNKSEPEGGELRVRYGFSGVTAFVQFLFCHRRRAKSVGASPCAARAGAARSSPRPPSAVPRGRHPTA